jgi:hypothetical protein
MVVVERWDEEEEEFEAAGVRNFRTEEGAQAAAQMPSPTRDATHPNNAKPHSWLVL